MDRDVALLIQGFLTLTPAQRSDFIGYVNSYNRGTQAERDSITNESIQKGARRVDVGPVTSGVCPCCHR